MAGTIRKMATYLGLVEDDQYYTDGESSNQGAATAADRGTGDRVAVREHAETREVSKPWSRERAAEETRPSAAVYETPGYRVPMILPTTYNDARRIGEEFRSGSPVIMDLTSMSDADAKRIVDFSAGLVFGLRGVIERLTAKVFLLSPEGVDVTDIAREQVGGEVSGRS
ncbi:MAG TPA: cell division protein SepF [Actinomycetota bacterium]|nr:cell division protein SepF [Actinomycetota bacterium]